VNAFCASGGYIYVFTGMIKFVRSYDELAGIIAHKIAHVDLRHTTQQMTASFGKKLLFELILGDNRGLLTEVAGQLTGFAYSRVQKTESDMRAIDYLCQTPYAPDSMKNFFIGMAKESGASVPTFLSAHPSPANRVQKLEEKISLTNCAGATKVHTHNFSTFQALLP
jgi:predicted Zn-dependent protease